MAKRPTYEELEQRVRQLEKEAVRRDRAEEALRANEGSYRLLFSAEVDAIIIVDAKTRQIVDANDAALALYQYSRDEFLQLKATELSAEPERSTAHIDKVASGKPAVVSPGPVERLHKKKDGTLFPVEISSGVDVLQGRRMVCAIIRDMTEHKRAEETIRESQARYKQLWDDAPVAYHTLDARGIILHVNQTEADVLGYTKEEMVGKPIFDFVLPEQRKDAKQRFRLKLAAEPIPKDVDRIYVRNDGSKMYVSVNDVLEYDSDGKVVGVRTTMVDVSERKRAEEALRESEERFRDIAYSMADWVWEVDKNGVYTYCSKRVEDILKYSPEEILGKTPFELMPQDEAKRIREVFSKLVQNKEPIKDLENWNISKDGEMVCLLTSGVPILDESGKAIGYRGVDKDITERKRAEEARRQSEKKYSTLVENSLTGIYIDQDEKIVFANNRFAEIYGYPIEELIGMETWTLVHPEDRPLTNRTRARRLKGESVPSEYLARGLTKAGETRWIARRNVLIEYQGRPAILGNIVDISRQKYAEEELRKTNEELKNFVDVVSHDLKTPIIAIQGFSARLRKTYQEKMGDKGRQYLSQIETSARRMEALVSDLLELSRIGRVVSTFSDVSSMEIVENVTAGLQDRLKDRGIKLAVAESLPTIHCDGERIYQVFENLIVNAIKFIGDSENPKIEIGYEDKGAFHQFDVRDNGVGIDPKWHRKVFEIFRRLKEIEDQEGTGLGLAIVYRIVSNHGGKVWVASEKGKGATFYFTLPKKS
jgi:PAS domain S-box-containing protein